MAGNIEAYNGQPIWFSPGTTRVAYSDASSSGYGGYVVELGPEFAHGLWSPTELELSSTWRKLKAVAMTLCYFADQLKGHAVKWFQTTKMLFGLSRKVVENLTCKWCYEYV